MNFVLHEPLGVVAAIYPYNYPIVLLAWQISAALATGNTCVIKPSEQTPLATLKLGEVFSHLPPGVFNVVTATRSGLGAARRTPGDGHDRVHRLGRDRLEDHGRGGAADQEAAARARRL